ncbi:hypothetical protein VZT92_001907 [Zoarces viviparus]|uniref:Uncharacterized protein n=1 Tax=Zoarces viviparus TaxID=48416 RepID=A0AAW1G495_ZOAVI
MKGLETDRCVQEVESEVERLSRGARESETTSRRMRKKNCPISGWRSAALGGLLSISRGMREIDLFPFRGGAEESILYFLCRTRAGQVVPS